MTKKRSELWTSITSSLFSKVDEEFIQNFRGPGGANARLAAWDPYDKSMRYYKFLLFNIARKKNDDFFNAYKKLNKTEVGNPVTVKISKCNIDIDYLFSIEEFLFLREHLNLQEVRNIVEIGAGFGRTCHGLLSLIHNVEEYTIVDLPEILQLSSVYLKRVIPDHFDKIRFIENVDENAIKRLSPDLVINIDSFQEMPPEVIDNYMDNLIVKSRMFYSKNPIGKYDPVNVGLMDLIPDELFDVYALGYCQDVYDIFDEDALREGRGKYCIAYRPGADWQLLADSPVEIFPYLHNALYRKT